MRSLRWASSCLLILVASVACDGDLRPGDGQLPELQRLGTSARVPPSLVDDLALVTPDDVCLIDSYRVRVMCGGRGWESPQTLGDEGGGPGEYRDPAAVVQGPGRTVGVLDYELGRFTLFALDGTVKASLGVPLGFQPAGPPDDGVWPGTFMRLGDTVWSAPMAWVSLERDTVERTLAFRYRSEATKAAPPGGVPAAARSPDGTFVFWVGGDYTLVRFSEEGRYLGEFSSPSYEPELPTERDVEAYREDMRELFGRDPAQFRLQEFRNEPKLPLIRGDPLRFDSAGRLWVATTRDRVERSYFDLFRGGDYLGSVSVRDRLLAFDLLGSTLAVLVERPESDSAGLHPRFVDWYRIGE